MVTRDQLLDAVWGYGSFPLTRTVDMHRQAPPQDRGPPGDPRHIITVHRVGYKFMVRSDEQ